MDPVLVVMFVIAVALAAVLGFSVWLVDTLGARRSVTTTRIEDGFAIRCALGRGTARLVIHEDMGRVYEVRIRTLPPTYCPPTEVLLHGHLQRLIDEREQRVGLPKPR